MTSTKTRKRVLSGMRPTGKLHLGNYVGALQNWVRMQDEYECFFCVVDWHALTTDYADTSQVKQNSLEVAFDWLAAGLDPERSVIFIQSHVPAHAELHLLLSMITPLGWLERVPTYKEQRDNIKDKDLGTYGFLGYPVLQSADILAYRADVVPVGEDQVAHIELTREIARRFNAFYTGIKHMANPALTGLPMIVPPGKPVFPEPQHLLTPSPKLPGTDGRKMSKSYGNSILLSDPESTIREKLRTMVNDPARAIRTNPGNPDRCPVGDLHKIFSDKDTMAKVYEGCRSAEISCLECKSWAADALIAKLRPIQQKRKIYEEDPRLAWGILEKGAEKARIAAEQTLKKVRGAMGMSLEYDPSLIKPQANANATLSIDESISSLKGEAFGDAMRNDWIAKLPTGINLKDIGSRTFLTSSRKRVGVASSHEQDRTWTFKPLERTVDVLVLLALIEKTTVADFVLPQRILQPRWKKFQREERIDGGKGMVVKLSVHQQGSDFFLDVQQDEQVQITEFRSNYRPLF